MLYHTRDMYFYHSTHEVNTAFGKDILFLTERKKISGKKKKKRYVEVGTEQQDTYH